MIFHFLKKKLHSKTNVATQSIRVNVLWIDFLHRAFTAIYNNLTASRLHWNSNYDKMTCFGAKLEIMRLCRGFQVPPG